MTGLVLFSLCSLPREGTARRQLFVTRKRAFTKNLTMLAPWSWTASLQNREKQISVVYKPPRPGCFVIAARSGQGTPLPKDMNLVEQKPGYTSKEDKDQNGCFCITIGVSCQRVKTQMHPFQASVSILGPSTQGTLMSLSIPPSSKEQQRVCNSHTPNPHSAAQYRHR